MWVYLSRWTRWKNIPRPSRFLFGWIEHQTAPNKYQSRWRQYKHTTTRSEYRLFPNSLGKSVKAMVHRNEEYYSIIDYDLSTRNEAKMLFWCCSSSFNFYSALCEPWWCRSVILLHARIIAFMTAMRPALWSCARCRPLALSPSLILREAECQMQF